ALRPLLRTRSALSRTSPLLRLCVLFLPRRASRTAFRCWSVRNDNLIYRAALRVACRSGRSASSFCHAERPELHSTRQIRWIQHALTR
ncbi:hypothetical protein CVE31_22215, partial [Pseudomonas syringae pv. actinidiae]|nr:hypothetical protein [Pseudomonas syringae pv. actinidiae]